LQEILKENKNSCALKSTDVDKIFSNLKYKKNNKIQVESKKSRNQNKFVPKSQLGSKTNKTMKEKSAKQFQHLGGNKATQFANFLRNFQRMRESSAKTNDSTK